MIRCDRGFLLYAYCTVKYSGRAESTMGPGNFSILHKVDGSLLIHGSTNVPPRNYQGPKSVLSIEDNQLVSRSKKETITVTLHQIKHYYEMEAWSSTRPTMSKTEQELHLKVLANPQWFTTEPILEIHHEMPTPLGTVDVCFITQKAWHIIEIKRGITTLSTVYQLQRYLDYLSQGRLCLGYTASPKIGKSAEKLMTQRNYRWVNVQFD